MKVWARIKSDGDYITSNVYSAVDGFKLLGVEVVKYTDINDILHMITKDDIVLDGIEQCNQVFNKFGITPELHNYPDCLQEFLGRRIWKDTINNIANDREKYTAGYFVKPVHGKFFTGKVITSLSNLIGCRNIDRDLEVLVSEPINILAEWRCFILNDDIIDVRPYGIDVADESPTWQYHYDNNTVSNMLDKVKNWRGRPKAFSMDIAVINTKEKLKGSYKNELDKIDIEKTVLVECNDAYALGTYGLMSIPYARFISARWSQLLSREDELRFA